MDNQRLNIQELRSQIKECRERYPHHWETSRRLINQNSLSTTIPVLIQAIQKASLMPSLQKSLIETIQQFGQSMKTRQMNQNLKEVTGMPPSKAVRALVVWGVLAVGENDEGSGSVISVEELELLLQESHNPYDILLHSQVPSLLDIGAGDLTFEQELVSQYVPRLRSQHKMLRLHAFDRLTPGSRVGGVYHKNPDHDGYLKSFPSEELQYQFWGGMDLGQFSQTKGALPSYTMCTCHAPANPTFAYEPSRVEPSLILKHLQAIRGSFHPGRFDGESVLEVSHQGKTLTFPPWKFNIVGPLALLKLMGQRSQVGVLSAIDDEVFWELLSQVLADDQFRPGNQIFTKENIPDIFGPVYKELSGLTIGERVDLSQIAKLRDPMPFGLTSLDKASKSSKFRYVEIRRGAFWEGIPSSFTAKQFSRMREESTPWWIIFIPDF